MSDKLTPLQQQLLDRADAIFDAVKNATEKAVDFAATQLPDIAIQYITFYRTVYTVQLAIGLILFIFGLYCIFRVGIFDSWKRGKDKWGYWADFRQGAMGMGVISTLVGFLITIFNFRDTVMVWFAPKIFLINTISELIKKVT